MTVEQLISQYQNAREAQVATLNNLIDMLTRASDLMPAESQVRIGKAISSLNKATKNKPVEGGNSIAESMYSENARVKDLINEAIISIGVVNIGMCTDHKQIELSLVVIQASLKALI